MHGSKIVTLTIFWRFGVLGDNYHLLVNSIRFSGNDRPILDEV